MARSPARNCRRERGCAKTRCARFSSVSRARIRKVFSRLAFEGLVTIEPNRGASVAKPSAEEAREIFAARRAIESAIVRMVAEKFEPRQKAALAKHIARETAAETRRDAAEMIRLSGEFHLLLAEMAGNRTLQKFLRELVTRELLVILAYEKPGQAELLQSRAPDDPRCARASATPRKPQS